MDTKVQVKGEESTPPGAKGEWLTVDGMVAEYPWTAGTLYGWRHRGVGPPSVRPGRRVIYRRADVERWLEEEAARERNGKGTTPP